MELHELGFRPEEIFPCESSGAGLLIPGRLDGRETSFLLNLSRSGPLLLDTTYAGKSGLTMEEVTSIRSAVSGRPRYDLAHCPTASLEVLGRRLDCADVPCGDVRSGREVTAELAGAVGSAVFEGGALATDATRGCCAFTTRHLPAAAANPDAQLSLYSVDGRPVLCTGSIRDADRLDGPSPMNLILDTSFSSTWLTVDYVTRVYRAAIIRWGVKLAYRRGQRMAWSFALPGGKRIKTRVRFLSAFTRDAAGALGQHHVDGIIGNDVLGRWVCLYDLDHGCVSLYSPGG